MNVVLIVAGGLDHLDQLESQSVFIIREANKIVAATSDSNSLYCLQDPREGARIAIAEAARNLACSGARTRAQGPTQAR